MKGKPHSPVYYKGSSRLFGRLLAPLSAWVVKFNALKQHGIPIPTVPIKVPPRTTPLLVEAYQTPGKSLAFLYVGRITCMICIPPTSMLLNIIK